MNVQANKVGSKPVLALIILVSHYILCGARGLQYVNQPRGSFIVTKAKPESRPMTLRGASNKAHTLQRLRWMKYAYIRLRPLPTESHLPNS